MRTSHVLASALAVVVAVTTTSFAQPSKAQAEMLFRQAKQLMAQKKFAEACDAFDASQKLDASLATALNQADCREKNGQLATAFGLFLEAQRQARGADAQLEKIAGDRAAKLEPRLSKLTIAVLAASKIDGLAVTRNGEVVDGALWNRALPVDGGAMAIVATAPGVKAWTHTVTVGNEGDTKVVDVPNLKAPPVAVKPPGTGTPGTGTPSTGTPGTGTDGVTGTSGLAGSSASIGTEGPSDGGAGGNSKLVPIVFAGAAALFAAGGIVAELSARSTYDDATKEADDAKQADLWDSANTKRYVAQGLAVGALACAGVSVWMFLRSPKASSDTVSIAPLASPSLAGLMIDGRF